MNKPPLSLCDGFSFYETIMIFFLGFFILVVMCFLNGLGKKQNKGVNNTDAVPLDLQSLFFCCPGFFLTQIISETIKGFLNFHRKNIASR